jgi:hypothetical protein
MIGRHPVSAVVTLNLIPLRRVALRAKALHVLDRGRPAEVERKLVIVVDELCMHAAVLADVMLARVDGALDMFRDVAAGLR